MILPGVSVMEWTVCCKGDSATAKGDPVAADIIYLKLSPDVENPRNVLKMLLFVSLWHTKRSRVTGIVIVLVEALREMIQVLPLDRLKIFVEEFDLWGIWV